jgi:hypothetical protein
LPDDAGEGFPGAIFFNRDRGKDRDVARAGPLRQYGKNLLISGDFGDYHCGIVWWSCQFAGGATECSA